jgi:hypothetical protein
VKSRIVCFILTVVALGSFLGLVSATYAADFHVTVGMDYWKPDWDYSTRDFDTVNATTSGMYGPNVRGSYGPFYLGISYMIGEFEISEFNDKGDRTDVTYIAGYTFLNYFTARVQYEDFKYTHDFDASSGIKQNQTGLGFGLGGFYPFGDTGLFVHGSAAYTPFGNAENELYNPVRRVKEDGDATKFSLDMGLGYSFEFPLAVSVGYRYSKSTTKDDFMEHEFKGFTASLSYTF